MLFVMMRQFKVITPVCEGTAFLVTVGINRQGSDSHMVSLVGCWRNGLSGPPDSVLPILFLLNPGMMKRDALTITTKHILTL